MRVFKPLCTVVLTEHLRKVLASPTPVHTRSNLGRFEFHKVQRVIPAPFSPTKRTLHRKKDGNDLQVFKGSHCLRVWRNGVNAHPHGGAGWVQPLARSSLPPSSWLLLILRPLRGGGWCSRIMKTLHVTSRIACEGSAAGQQDSAPFHPLSSTFLAIVLMIEVLLL